MARWEPDARGRLLHAALDLFDERGYEATTTAQIADRAGLTKATFFRLFTDKREVLFQGQAASVEVAVSGVRSTPDDATPTDALRVALRALCGTHDAEHQRIGRRIEDLTASTPELRERADFKRSTITAALAAALASRTGEPRLAGVLADLGIRAYYDGFSAWISARTDDDLATIVEEELDSLIAVLPRIVALDERPPAALRPADLATTS